MSSSNRDYYFCCQDKYFFPNYYLPDSSCDSYLRNFKWELRWFNSTDCPMYLQTYKAFSYFDIFAICLQTFACLGLIFVAMTICCIRDKKRRVTAHPSIIIAQICLIQAILYIFMLTANIATTCRIMNHSLIKQMIGWVPVKNDLLSYYKNPVDSKTITFRLIWFTSHEMVGFMGLFSILLQGFFLADVIYTWRNPIKYLSAQKHVIPIFLAFSKLG